MFSGFEVEMGMTGDGIAPTEPRPEREREYDFDEAMASRARLGQVLTAVHAAAEEEQVEEFDKRAVEAEMDWRENHDPERWDGLG